MVFGGCLLNLQTRLCVSKLKVHCWEVEGETISSRKKRRKHTNKFGISNEQSNSLNWIETVCFDCEHICIFFLNYGFGFIFHIFFCGCFTLVLGLFFILIKSSERRKYFSVSIDFNDRFILFSLQVTMCISFFLIKFFFWFAFSNLYLCQHYHKFDLNILHFFCLGVVSFVYLCVCCMCWCVVIFRA